MKTVSFTTLDSEVTLRSSLVKIVQYTPARRTKRYTRCRNWLFWPLFWNWVLVEGTPSKWSAEVEVYLLGEDYPLSYCFKTNGDAKKAFLSLSEAAGAPKQKPK